MKPHQRLNERRGERVNANDNKKRIFADVDAFGFNLENGPKVLSMLCNFSINEHAMNKHLCIKLNICSVFNCVHKRFT